MNTPICDFVREYVAAAPIRLHMPGHKGQGTLGEPFDITEIPGADSLYQADGIIRQSEENAGQLFGAATFYSTEGSSQCIRAMLYLACLQAKRQGRLPRIAAGRNAHKAFLSAAALLDVDLLWLSSAADSYLSCPITPAELEQTLINADPLPTAVYLTSPDYLGNTVDVEGLAEVCHRHGALLLIDNAHGAYLKFLPSSRHPMDLGADLCCDSAHKTLPVLTGGAYLHLSKNAPNALTDQAKNALALFGSTSPSYLILQSLDQANQLLARGYGRALAALAEQVDACKTALAAGGYTLVGDEPLKITLAPKGYGYTGLQLATILEQQNVICEFADPDFIVFMITPQIAPHGLDALKTILLSLPPRDEISSRPPEIPHHRRVMSLRQATLSPQETLPVERCVGKILASPSVGCPPAVPILVCGEEITPADLALFSYYGIETCTVVC